MPPNSQKVFEVGLPFEPTMNLVKQVLQEIPAPIHEVDEQKGILLAKKGPSVKSWGENIRVQVEQIPDMGCRIRVESESALATTLVDWGVNDDNVATFERRLAYHLSQLSQPPPQPSDSPAPQGVAHAPQTSPAAPYAAQPNQPPYAYPPRPLKDRSIALILEILPGLFGFLGLGWIYGGNTNTGLVWLVSVLVWDFIAFFIVVLTAGFGCFCTVPVNLTLIAISVSSLNTYTKQHPELFGP
jgi:hypothetical protein